MTSSDRIDITHQLFLHRAQFFLRSSLIHRRTTSCTVEIHQAAEDTKEGRTIHQKTTSR